MKKSVNFGIILLVIVAGIVFGSKLNDSNVKGANTTQQTIETKDPYKELRSDGKHIEDEDAIKRTVDKYMFENFGNTFKTTWYDSISASSAVINEYGRLYIVQSKGDHAKAKKYVSGLLGFFNSKTTNVKYRVGKVVLVDKEYKIIYQVDTLK